MASTMALNKADIKSAMIALAIAVGGGLYWMYRQNKAGNKVAGNAYNGMLNNASASSGSAGAIAPSSTLNTYNVFPQVSSQMSSATPFFNGGHSHASPNPLSTTTRIWTSNGQGFPLPVRG